MKLGVIDVRNFGLQFKVNRCHCPIAINLFNPQKVVIAGEITDAEKVLLPAIQSCINTQVLKDFRRNLPIVKSELNHQSAIGAFALVKRAMLNGVLLQRLMES